LSKPEIFIAIISIDKEMTTRPGVEEKIKRYDMIDRGIFSRLEHDDNKIIARCPSRDQEKKPIRNSEQVCAHK
jgi:hypothetical protein